MNIRTNGLILLFTLFILLAAIEIVIFIEHKSYQLTISEIILKVEGDKKIESIQLLNDYIINRGFYFKIIFSSILLGIFGFIIFSVFFVRGISSSIKNLLEVIERESLQDLQNTIDEKDYIGFSWFIKAFNTISARLSKTMEKLKAEAEQSEKNKEALKVSESRYRSLVANVPGVTFRCSCDDWNMEFLSNEIEKLSGYTADIFLNDEPRPFESIVFHEDVQKLRDCIMESVNHKKNFNVEYRIVHKDGSIVWVYEKGLGIYGDNGNLLFLDGVIVDISEIKKAELEMVRLRMYLQNMIDSMPSMIIGVNPDGIITHWNNKTEGFSGLSSSLAIGRPLKDIFPWLKLESDQIHKAIDQKRELVMPKRSIEKAGKNIIEEITIYPLVTSDVDGAVIRIDDVTEKSSLEEMIVQSEKMLSVGGLAAGMAHEINNPLAGIIQTAGVMANRLGKNLNMPANIKAANEAGTYIENIKNFMEKRDIFRMLNIINESGRRIADIVNDMLGFSRKSNNTKSTFDLKELIEKSLNLAASDYDLKKKYDFKKILIIKEFEDQIPQIICDGSKIQQVLLNLLRNGSQAMQEAETEHPQFIIRMYLEKNIGMVSIDIIDNGPGMSEEIRKRLFEPFFTTKSEGLGMGLGLSVSYFIITDNHDGELLVESQPGKGARFTIRLPLNN